MKRTMLLTGVCILSLAAASPAMAERGQGGGSFWSSIGALFDDKERGADKMLRDNFTREERAVIRTVFDELFGDNNEETRTTKNKNKKGLPPGLAKRQSLPPGLQKQIDETGTLPPGLAKRDLPDDLKRRLPRVAKGQEIVWVDDDVYLIETATRAVLDVVKDVLN